LIDFNFLFWGFLLGKVRPGLGSATNGLNTVAVMVGAVVWIKIQIRIDLGQLDPDPAPGGTK
jgi:hypothetical protein